MLGASLQLTNKLQARRVSLTEITCAVAVGSCILVSLPGMSSVVSLLYADESFNVVYTLSLCKLIALLSCFGLLCFDDLSAVHEQAVRGPSAPCGLRACSWLLGRCRSASLLSNGFPLWSRLCGNRMQPLWVPMWLALASVLLSAGPTLYV